MAITALAPDTPDLTDQQARFCLEYLRDLNQTKAAIRAGYSPLGADAAAVALRKDIRIQGEIARLEARQVSASDVSGAVILRELQRLATFNTAEMFDERGNLKPPKDWTPEMSASVASFEVVARNLSAGDGSTDTIHKVRLYDKTRALELLAKHLSLLIDRVEHTGTIQIQWLDGPSSTEVHVLPAVTQALELAPHVQEGEVEGVGVGVGGGGEEQERE